MLSKNRSFFPDACLGKIGKRLEIYGWMIMDVGEIFWMWEQKDVEFQDRKEKPGVLRRTPRDLAEFWNTCVPFLK